MDTTNPFDTSVFPVILAGGGGTRLWPASRPGQPKQFLSFDGKDSLFQATVRRLIQQCPAEHLRVVCGRDHQSRIEAELAALAGADKARILPEPCGRNTGPAVLLAVESLCQEHRDPIVIVLPADHAISDDVAFHRALAHAIAVARQDYIVTLGIKPTRAETGYGYILAGPSIGNGPAHKVERFEEKPDHPTAEKYVKDGHHLWNAGIFVARAQILAAEFAAFQPDMCGAVERFIQGVGEAYDEAPSLSIDYAVMEHTRRAAVIPIALGWTDLGDWQAVDRLARKDDSGNHREGDVLLHGCRDTYVKSEGPAVAAIGLENTAIVACDDAVLVTRKDRAQELKALVPALNGMLAEAAREDRPWGSFTVLGKASTFKTKRLDVLPGKRTSLQRHHYRTEHWVIAAGTARVTVNQQVTTLHPGETALIPAGAMHRLENPGPDILTVVEVQLGEYFGEDDIERFEDDYGRAPKATGTNAKSGKQI